MIDDQYAPLTEKIIEVISNFSSEPIRFIINTHMHPDHTGGNENFGKRGALIVGHENVRSQMKVAGYDQTPPFVTFSRDECERGCSFGAYFSSLSATLPAARRTNNLTILTDSIAHRFHK